MGFPIGNDGKEPTCQCRRYKTCGFDPWVRKIPWRRAWQPTPMFLCEESHGQRSLASYSPWGPEEPDATAATEHTHTQTPFGVSCCGRRTNCERLAHRGAGGSGMRSTRHWLRRSGPLSSAFCASISPTEKCHRLHSSFLNAQLPF